MNSPRGSVIITVRNEVAKVMFSQACVCPQGEGCLVPGGGAWSRRGVSGPGGVPALGRGVPAPAGSAPAGSAPGGGIPACTEADPPAETATAADGTHPTGMHSCC